jgi:hypothetical protein
MAFSALSMLKKAIIFFQPLNCFCSSVFLFTNLFITASIMANIIIIVMAQKHRLPGLNEFRVVQRIINTSTGRHFAVVKLMI